MQSRIGEGAVPISDGVNFEIKKKGAEQVSRVPVEKVSTQKGQNPPGFSLSPTGEGKKMDDSLRNSMDNP